MNQNRYVDPFIRAERETKIMTEMLCLGWGEHIPICETTASMSREDAYEEYAYWCIKKLKEYGICDSHVPTVEDVIMMCTTYNTTYCFLGRDNNRFRNMEEYYGFGRFWPQFYYRLGDWETISEYCMRTNIDKSTAFAYW
jgi:hypothetical protein